MNDFYSVDKIKMHYIEEKFKTIIVLNGMRAVFRSLPSCWSFLIHFFGTLLPRVSATCPVPPDGQLLEGEQIPLCPKFSEFIGREENFWEGELSNQAKSSYLSKIISAVDRDDLPPNIIFNPIQILKISSTRIKYSSFSQDVHHHL